MEAVPRLPMLWFPLKFSPEGTSFASLKKYIAECYQENPDTYSKEVYSLETLRNAAMHPTKDVTGCATLKRYYCQLHSLANRFPQVLEKNLFTFTWKDLYVSNVAEVADFRYEMAAVLFNVAAHHTQLGASVSRDDADGMKLACTHFQIAAWSYGELREKYQGINGNSDFMTPELLLFMQQVSFAQAQECILEKSLIDNRKPAIVAKVTAQIVSYYGAALAAMLSGGDDGTIADIIGNGVFKDWKKYVRFKISYLNSILFLYQGQQSEEQQKMGERVVLFQAAWDNLEEARKESKGMAEQKEIIESLTFTADVVEAKRKAAKNENEFIYHEAVPELRDIAAVQGANLVNGINFSVTDPEVAGEDIFARLIPMKAHEASSMYSEEKAQLLRKIGSKVTEKDNELNTFMSSLNVEHLNVSEERANKIPQGIVDRCASLNAKTNAIPDLISSMSSLAEICADVETNLKEIKELLNREEVNEKKYQQESGVHRSNAHFTELSREFQKYLEAHQKAGDSNDTLRRAMELHVNNLRILAKPLQEIQSSVPKLSGDINESVFHDLKLILNKVNEMKAQRAQFCADLRIAINNDDITSQIIAFGDDNDIKELFKKQISKHDKITTLIEQNLIAQTNILAALTENYAKCAPILKAMNDVKHKKENFFSSLAASYDVYEDLLAKSAKGLEFYKKLQGNVQKLVARVRAACDVQDEERQQRMNSSKPTKINVTIAPSTAKSNTPKLKDYLKSGKPITNSEGTYIPTIRPNPLGSESAPSSTCTTSTTTYYSSQSQQQQIPNDYPPPYSPPTQQYYEANGYTNPIYQSNQITDPNMKLDFNYMGYDQQLQYQNSMQSYQSIQSAAVPSQSYQNLQPSATSSHSNHSVSQSNSTLPQATAQYQYPTSADSSTSIPYQANPSYQYPTQTAVDLQSAFQAQQMAYLQQQQQQQQQQQLHLQSPTVSSVASLPSAQMPTSTWYPAGVVHSMENLSIQNNPQQVATSIAQQSTTWNQNGMMEHMSQQAAGNWNPIDSSASHNMQQSSTPYYSYQHTGQVQPSDLQYGYQQPVDPIQTQADVSNPYNMQSSYLSHPGYVFNQMTGEYQYGSGYQDPNAHPNIYSQYTNAIANQNSNTTDSSNLSTVGQTFANQYSTTVDQPTTQLQQQQQQQQQPDATQNNNASYYHVPYGYQSPNVPYAMPTVEGTNPVIQQQNYNNVPPSNAMTYIQSNNSTTNTTISGNYADSNVESGYTTPQKKESNTKPKTVKKSSNIDLLSDIDFSASAVSTPPLQPQAATPKTESPTPPFPEPSQISEKSSQPEPILPAPVPKVPEQHVTEISSGSAAAILTSIDRKPSCDNLSLCSDLSSLDHSFDWDSISVRNEQSQTTTGTTAGIPSESQQSSRKDPFDDAKILKYFHKEVERYEKMIETLNIKMLNGNTPLVNKWKELQDLLVRDEAKRTTSIGKLFPEKNRSTDCIPFDHARVVLERSTDDYINAAYVKDLGPGCPSFILAQTPLPNTVNDFWSMIWAHKARTVVCLHTPNEILDTFWPQDFNKEMHFDDFSVTLIKQFDLSHCVELNLKLTMNGADAILDLSLIQIKAWTKSSPAQLLGIAQNILVAYKQRCQEFKSTAPLIMNCLTGSERSGLIALAICAILATQNRRPILINIVDVWYRISSQRKSALRDTSNLELSMQIVLSHGHDLLNKRGIMTSYQMKNIQTVTSIEQEEVKDPLNDLDPLWKLKQN